MGAGNESARARAIQELHRIGLVHLVGDQGVHALARVAVRCVYCAGQEILGEDDDSGDIFAVDQGAVRLYRGSPGGREVTLMIVLAGEFFGAGVIDPNPRIRGCLEAMRDGTVVYRIPRDAWRAVMESGSGRAIDTLDAVSHQLAEVVDRLGDIPLYNVTVRLAHELARQAARDPGGYVRTTHAELAALIGCTPTGVTKALSTLRRLGLIEGRLHRRGIRVPDGQRLAAYTEEEH